MKKSTLLLLLLVFSSSLIGQSTKYYTQSIYFASAQYDLDAVAKRTLDELILTLKESPDFALRIEAFTDEQGAASYNDDLAQRRANSTLAYLVAQDVHPLSQTLKSFGESQQKKMNNLDDMRRINRRVDILITVYYFEDLNSLVGQLKQEEQAEVFRFNLTDEKQEFTSAKGTKIIVPGNAFEFQDGSRPTEMIELELVESYEPSSWFLNRLSTETDDGQLLQTAGMVRTKATSLGKDLRLRTDKAITVSVPSQEVTDAEMKLFYGEKHKDDASQKDRITWRTKSYNLRNSVLKKGKKNTVPMPVEIVDYIKNSKLVKMDKPEFPTYSHLPYPKAPVKLKKPRFYMKAPKREKVVFRPSGLKERLMSKEARKKIEDERFEKKQKNYLERKARFEKRLANYNLAKANAKKEQERYKLEMDAWKFETHQRVHSWMSFKVKKRDYIALQRTQRLFRNANKVKIACDAARFIGINNLISTSPAVGFGGYLDGDSNPFLDMVYTDLMIELPDDARKSEAKEMIWSFYETDSLHSERFNLANYIDSKDEYIRYNKLFKDRVVEACAKNGHTNSLRAYVFDITEMGWCNVDRIMKISNQQPLIVSVEEPDDAMMMVMLTSIKSAITMIPLKGGQYQSRLKLPSGEKVKLVSIKVIEGKAQLAIQEFVVGQKKPKLKYRSIRFDELRNALNQLNG